MYENQRKARQKFIGLTIAVVIVLGINLVLGITYARAPERSKQSLCAEVLSPSDLTCAVQSHYDKSEAETWWAIVDGALLFIVLAVRRTTKHK